MKQMVRLAPFLIYDERYIANVAASDLFHSLSEQVDWNRPTVQVFGKSHLIPRMQAWMADEGVSYRYSNLILEAARWHESVDEIRKDLNATFGYSFNSALLNYYRNGDDKMGWHADNEPELGASPAVAIVSLGSTRDLQIRENRLKETTNVALNSGSLIVMEPGFQRAYQHQIPVRKRVTEGRISITFREILK